MIKKILSILFVLIIGQSCLLNKDLILLRKKSCRQSSEFSYLPEIRKNDILIPHKYFMVCSNLKHQKVNWIFYYLHLSDSESKNLGKISRAGLNYSYVFSQFIGARVDLWKRTENLLREFCLSKGELAIFSGPIYDSNYQRKKSGSKFQPSSFFVLAFNPLNYASPLCMIVNNCDKTADAHIVSVDELENVSGINFFGSLNKAEQARVEQGVINWHRSKPKNTATNKSINYRPFYQGRDDTWYYGLQIDRLGDLGHSMIWNPTSNLIYEINAPNNGEGSGIQNWIKGNGLKIETYRYNLSTANGYNNWWNYCSGLRPKRKRINWQPIHLMNADNSEYFFESKHGQIWDYRLFSNNCKHYAQKGLTVGGADVRFITLAPAEWPGKFTFSWYNPN